MQYIFLLLLSSLIPSLTFFVRWNRTLIRPTPLKLVLIYIYILKMDRVICYGKNVFLLLAPHGETFIMHFLFILLFTYI